MSLDITSKKKASFETGVDLRLKVQNVLFTVNITESGNLNLKKLYEKLRQGRSYSSADIFRLIRRETQKFKQKSLKFNKILHSGITTFILPTLFATRCSWLFSTASAGMSAEDIQSTWWLIIRLSANIEPF